MRKFLITVNEKQYEVEVEEVRNGRIVKPAASKGINGNGVNGNAAGAGAAPAANGSSSVNSPMPGSILKVNVNKGDMVSKGQALLILEAMKMENEIKAPKDGKVQDIKVSTGQSVNLGQPLLEIA